MGQAQTSGVPGRRKSLRNSLRSPFPRRSRANQSLSATFNYLEPETKGPQLNLNTATAEELMTLPGVTRAIAQNIVEYRQAIGRFHKVEDLALVSGVGAEKLNVMRPEICIHKRRNHSTQSSRAQSIDSLVSSDSSPRPVSVNINAANVFTLMTLRGVTQELAANIVDHRERRGPFTSVNDLLKVRGINALLLSGFRTQLNVGPHLVSQTPLPSNKRFDTALVNNATFSKFAGNKPKMNGYKDILEVLCAFSQRPYVDDVFSGQRDGKPALRIASWNLSALTQDKVDNPGVREVICRTMLENKFSLVVTQEVMHPMCADKIAEELTEPRLRKVLEWKGKLGLWRTNTVISFDRKRSCGFLYDIDSVLQDNWVEIIQDDKNALVCTINFVTEDETVTIMNISMTKNCPRNLCNTLLSRHQPDIFAGDFSIYPEAEFAEEGYTRVLLSPTVTNSVNPNNNNGAIFSDNIYLNKRTLSRYTGMSGIVRQGLNHVAIPRGWSWGGPASEHCPVWCELFT